MYECFATQYAFTVKSCYHLAQPPKLEDHPLSAVRDCLFNIFAATLHTVGRSTIRSLRTRHAVVTGTHLLRTDIHVLVTFYVNVLKASPLFKKQ